MTRPSDLQIDPILRLPEVREITGLSRSSICARQECRRFPHSLKLSDRAVGTLESEVKARLLLRIIARQTQHAVCDSARAA